jgi:hypothetical protein
MKEVNEYTVERMKSDRERKREKEEKMKEEGKQ